jgi:hypothetical protein
MYRRYDTEMPMTVTPLSTSLFRQNDGNYFRPDSAFTLPQRTGSIQADQRSGSRPLFPGTSRSLFPFCETHREFCTIMKGFFNAIIPTVWVAFGVVDCSLSVEAAYSNLRPNIGLTAEEKVEDGIVHVRDVSFQRMAKGRQMESKDDDQLENVTLEARIKVRTLTEDNNQDDDKDDDESRHAISPDERDVLGDSIFFPGANIFARHGGTRP